MSAGGVRGKKAAFKICWHRDRSFDFLVDTAKATLHIPLVLPQVPARSAMYREFKGFLAERSSKEMLAHRRIDSKKARVACGNKGGNVSVTLTVRGTVIGKLTATLQTDKLTFTQKGRRLATPRAS